MINRLVSFSLSPLPPPPLLSPFQFKYRSIEQSVEHPESLTLSLSMCGTREVIIRRSIFCAHVHAPNTTVKLTQETFCGREREEKIIMLRRTGSAKLKSKHENLDHGTRKEGSLRWLTLTDP